MKENMKALRFYGPGKPLKIEEIPIPVIRSDSVLVDIKATGICGSDIHILEGDTQVGKLPITLGHEMSGQIAAVGRRVEDWTAGDRVCVNSIISCGHCPNCLVSRNSICTVSRNLIGIHFDGGLAEYCEVPARNLIRLPDNIPFDIGAIITDAVATPFHALIRQAKLQMGNSVAIFGIGGLGYHAVKLAKLAGASFVIAVDIEEENLKRATAAGADVVINSRESNPVEIIKELTNGYGADITLESVGLTETLDQAVQSIRRGGKAIAMGIGVHPIKTLPASVFVRGELELIGASAFDTIDIEILVKLVANGKLNLSSSVTDRLPLEKAGEALDRLWNKVGNPIRIVVCQD